MVTGPKGPFDALTHGQKLYRVFGNRSGRRVADLNPGFGRPTRFAFFGDPVVPVLYAAATAGQKLKPALTPAL